MKRIKIQEKEQLIELSLRGNRKDTMKRTGGRAGEELEEKDLFLGDCKKGGWDTKEVWTKRLIYINEGEESDGSPVYCPYFFTGRRGHNWVGSRRM